MCKLKSLILTEKEVFCPANTNSHSDILERNNITDNERIPNFVKIEITPPNNDVFAPLDKWVYSVDQDNTPKWYIREIDEKRAREAVAEWAKTHIFIGVNDREISADGTLYLKNCKNIIVRNSTVEAYNNSTVEVYNNSTVKAYNNSTVKAYNNSTVEAWGNSTVEAYNNSTVEAYNNSTVKAYDDSTILAYNNSVVKAWGNSTIKAWDNSIVILLQESNNKRENIILAENATLKDCKDKTIYQSGDWKMVLVDKEKCYE